MSDQADEVFGTHSYGEGPVWFGDARCVLWSDIPNDRIMRWDEETGRLGVYRRPSNYANGLTRDRQGWLIACEHGSRRVTRTEYDGSITVLIDKFDGKRKMTDADWRSARGGNSDIEPMTPKETDSRSGCHQLWG